MAQVFERPVVEMIFFKVVAVVILCVGVLTTVKSDQTISLLKHVDCERQCPYYYFPICATNGITTENRMFVNICEMQAWNCDAKQKYRRTRNTACKDYDEYVDDLWLSSHKPSKVPNGLVGNEPKKPSHRIA